MMPKQYPETKQPDRRPTGPVRPDRFPFFAVAASLLAHAVVIAIVANTELRPTEPVLDPSVPVMRLLPRPAAEPPPPATDESIPPTPVETEADAQSAIDTGVAPIADEPATTEPPAGDEPIVQADRGRPGTFSAELLDQLQSLPAEAGPESRNRLPWTAIGESIPGVPGVRGWISEYVGTVAPSAHSWKEIDGSSRGRYVLADGTIICTRRRAPTIDELMNPWKSIAVTMGGFCGRQRAAPADFSDPRIQPPPGALE